MKPTVVLFDVDGTLVRTGGAGSRALRRAFGEVHGAPDAPRAIDVRGNTDGRIVADALALIGIEPTEAAIDHVLDAYLVALADEVAASPGYEVLAGVREILESLDGRDGYAIGLGTGNVMRGAAIKLARGGLDRYFDFGGYGCDSAHRPSLVRAGAERGARKLGVDLGACRVVVLGDTPRDIDAARAIGADVVAVATGGHPLDELAGHGPDLAVESLSDARVRALLGH